MVWALPLSTIDLSTDRLSAIPKLAGIRSLVRVGRNRFPLAYPVLYPQQSHITRYLNSFRGEPAISEFDWPFTPSHRSSPTIATVVGSALQNVSPLLQPAHN